MEETPKMGSSRRLGALVGGAFRFVIDRVEPRRVRLVAWVLLASNLMVLVVAFATSDAGHTALSFAQGADNAALGGDYAAFYNAGVLLNRYPHWRIYDLELQDQLFHELFPKISSEKTLYFAHPPFVAAFFRPLALLPFSWSYLIWLFLSLGLFVAGLRLVWATTEALPRKDWPLVLLLGVSFQPFIMESWRGGQLSPFGFFLVALALRCWKVRRNFEAGLALGVCLYKPTLLVLILPMLLIARQFRTLFGFAASGLVLGLASLAAVGERGCLSYLDVLKIYSSSSMKAENFFLKAKFVDLSSLLTMLHWRDSAAGVTAALAFATFTLAWLASRWWSLDGRDGPDRALLFATTFTLSLVVNLHVAIYDTILAVPGILVAAEILEGRRKATDPPLTTTFKALLVLLYFVPYYSHRMATTTGLQPYTLVLAAIGWYQLALVKSPGIGKVGAEDPSQVP